MNTINSIYTVIIFLATFSLSVFNSTSNLEKADKVSVKIDNYLSDINFEANEEYVTIFSNFIIKENEDLFNVDFMVTETNEVILLSKNYEDEFYRVDSFNSDYMKRLNIPVALVGSN